MKKQGEPHYRYPINLMRERGGEELGLASAWAWYDDPKRLAFTFARYKFIAKMLYGRQDVLEAGCGDGFFSRVVAQSVGHLTAVDFDDDFITDAQQKCSDRWPIAFRVQDLVRRPVDGCFDAIYSLDVLEHIKQQDEGRFLQNLLAALAPHGVVIIGTPSLESQVFASPQSKAGHVNCKTQDDLRGILSQYFHNVFMFSMNDEMIHTGFAKMSHYNLALCCERR